MTLTFNPLRAVVVTYSRAEGQGQRSVGSKDRMETNGRIDTRTDPIKLPSSIMRPAIIPNKDVVGYIDNSHNR